MMEVEICFQRKERQGWEFRIEQETDANDFKIRKSPHCNGTLQIQFFTLMRFFFFMEVVVGKSDHSLPVFSPTKVIVF